MADDTPAFINSDTPVLNAVEIQDGSNNWIPDANSTTQVNADLAAGATAHDHAVSDTATAQQLTVDLGQVTGNTNQDKLSRATITSERQNYRDASYGLQAEANAYGAAANAYQPPVVAAPAAPVVATPPVVTASPVVSNPLSGGVPTTIGVGASMPPSSPISTSMPTPTNPTPVPGTTVVPTSPSPSSSAAAAASDSATTAASSTATNGNSDPTRSATTSDSDSATAAASSTATNSNAAGNLSFITVKAGDTLTGIAEANNVPLAALEATNRANVPDPNMIYVDQKIYLPNEGSAPVANPTTTTSQNPLGSLGGATSATDDIVRSAINGGHDSTDIADKSFKRN
jgi:LysM repeat protein